MSTRGAISCGAQGWFSARRAALRTEREFPTRRTRVTFNHISRAQRRLRPAIHNPVWRCIIRIHSNALIKMIAVGWNF